MIARRSFLIMVTQATSAIMGVVGLFVLAKCWGEFATTALGVIGFGMASIGMFSFLMNMGFDSAHIKRVSEGQDLGRCIGTFLAIKLVLTGCMIAAVFGSLAIWTYVLHQGIYDATKESALYLFMGVYVLLSLAQVPTFTFVARREIAKHRISETMEALTRVPLAVLVVLAGVTGAYVGTSALNPIDIPPRYPWPEILQPIQEFLAAHAIGALTTTYLIGAAAVFITAYIMFRRYPIKRPTREFAKSYLAFAAPMMVVQVIAVISINLDKVLLGYFWIAEEVGYYFAAQRLATLVMMFSTAAGVVLFPTISSFHTEERFDDIRHTTHSVERYVSMLITPLVIFMILFSDEIIAIFLTSSFHSADSLRILSLYVLFNTLSMPYAYVIQGMDRPGLLAKIFVIGYGINICLNLLFIPANGILSPWGVLGASGAAAASAISMLLICIGLRIGAERVAGFRAFQARVVHHFCAAILAALALHLFRLLLNPLRWYHLLGLTLIGLGIYLAVLWAIGEFRRGELKLILDTINPRGIIQYIKSELKGKGES
ncbi:MAG: flippase [Candidatus Thermoplasmatota archaeon]